MLQATNRITAKIIAGLFGLIGAMAFSSIGWPGYALMVLAPLLTVLVHELGHATAAHALGMNVRTICVGPIELRTKPLRFGFAQRLLGRDVGGHVEFDDTRGRQLSRKIHIIIAMSGPLANLASAVALLLLANLLGNGAPAVLLAGFSATSIAAFILSAWPFKTLSGRGNDAWTVLAALDLKPALTLRRKPKRSSWQAR